MKIFWILMLLVALAAAGCKKSGTAPKAPSGDAGSDSSAAADSAPVALHVKWPVGNRYSQRMEMSGDTEIFMPMSPKPMLQKVSVNQEYSVTVLGARPKNGRELELEFE